MLRAEDNLLNALFGHNVTHVPEMLHEDLFLCVPTFDEVCIQTLSASVQENHFRNK